MTHQRIGPGFAVLYRWRVHEDKIDQFISAWSSISARLLTDGGSLGSRLHRGQDGLWYSYAQWPSAEARERAFATPVSDPSPGIAMRDAIEESFPELILESVSDYLQPPPQ